MAETPFTLTIDTDEMSPQRLGEVLREFTGLLNALDSELSADGARNLDWRLVSISYNSPLTLTAAASPRRHRADTGPALARACIRGMAALEAGGERPVEFNDDALEHVKRLASITDGKTEAIRFSSPVEDTTARITRLSVASVERVLPSGYSIGSVEGRLEGLNIHRQPEFTVYDAVTQRAVRCYFSESDLDAVTKAIGHKVIVGGRLRRDPEGHPRQVRQVDFFGVIDEPPAVAPRDAAGAFGMMDDPENYLERIRGR